MKQVNQFLKFYAEDDFSNYLKIKSRGPALLKYSVRCPSNTDDTLVIHG